MQQIVDYMTNHKAYTFLCRGFCLERIDVGQDKVPYKTHCITYSICDRDIDNRFEQQI